MLQRLWSQIGDIVVLAGISFAFGLVKIIFSPEPTKLRISLASVFVSVTVGTLAGLLALSMQWGDYVALSCSSVVSLLARDIIVGILQNKDFLGRLLKRAAINVTDKVTK